MSGGTSGSTDTVLHRIEALPGDGRYAVTWQRADGSEQTATVELSAGSGDLRVAEASLPQGWRLDSDAFRATVTVIAGFDAARRQGPPVPTLRDVAGGWDVSLGNVVLGPNGVPQCTAHGDMAGTGTEYTCAECGARALVS